MTEEFEKWAQSQWFDLERDLEAPENYVCDKTTTAFEAWQASRKQALEEAAEKCEEWGDALNDHYPSKAATAISCADAIRALQQ